MMLESLDMNVALLDDGLPATRPYESDRARMAAVYSLPVRVPEPRVLEIRSLSDAEPRLFRSSDIARVTADGLPPHTPAESYDLIVMHRTLDRLSDNQDRGRAYESCSSLLQWAATLLSPLGALAGAVSNRLAGWHPACWGRGTSRDGAWLAAQNCEQLLSATPLTNAEVFGIHPTADAPLTILSLHSRTYRGHALREMRRHAAGFSRTGYAARMLWHATGCGRHLHRDLMFWAFRS